MKQSRSPRTRVPGRAGIVLAATLVLVLGSARSALADTSLALRRQPPSSS